MGGKRATFANPTAFENEAKQSYQSFTIACFDVKRGKEVYTHYGNRRLKVLVDINLEKYIQAKSKLEKTIIVSSIVETIREASTSGGFVRKCPKTGEWHEVRNVKIRKSKRADSNSTQAVRSPKHYHFQLVPGGRRHSSRKARSTLSRSYHQERSQKACSQE